MRQGHQESVSRNEHEDDQRFWLLQSTFVALRTLEELATHLPPFSMFLQVRWLLRIIQQTQARKHVHLKQITTKPK